MRRAVVVLCALILVGVGFAIPATASHIVGIKATVVTLDVPTLSVDMDLTLYTNGDQYDSSSYVGGNAGYPMIDWDDGATFYATSIPAVSSGPPALYRGSFSHTYAGTGPYTVTVASDCCATYTGGGTVTGNRVAYNSQAPTFEIFTNTTVVDFAAVPAANWGALAALAAMMMLAGVYLLRR